MSKLFSYSSAGLLAFAAILIVALVTSRDRAYPVRDSALPRSAVALMVAERNFSGSAEFSSILPLIRSKSDYCTNPGDEPEILAKLILEELLVAPSSATFPRPPITSKLADCRFVVLGDVDSQNGFGAMIRSGYRVEMRFDADERRWTDFEYSVN